MVHGARMRERLAGPFWRLGGDPCRLAGGVRMSACLCACVAATGRSTGDGRHLGQPWQPAGRLLAGFGQTPGTQPGSRSSSRPWDGSDRAKPYRTEGRGQREAEGVLRHDVTPFLKKKEVKTGKKKNCKWRSKG